MGAPLWRDCHLALAAILLAYALLTQWVKVWFIRRYGFN